MNKQCSKCKIYLATEMFTKDNTKKDGYYSSCKKCVRSWRVKVGRIGIRENLSEEYKRCAKCKKVLRKDNDFAKDSSKKDGYYSSCKDCRRIQTGVKKRIRKKMDSGGYKFGVKNRLHREIMGNIIGRKLNRNEIVHHKNGDKTDNRPENLEIMTNSEHSKYHYEKEIKEKLLKKRYYNKQCCICFNEFSSNSYRSKYCSNHCLYISRKEYYTKWKKSNFLKNNVRL